MDKYCELCYARDAKPCMECSTCNPGHRNFRPAPTPPPTHADRIRSMSDEEMAGFIDDIQNDAFAADGCGYSLHFPDDKETTWIDWLRKPAEEVNDGQTI